MGLNRLIPGINHKTTNNLLCSQTVILFKSAYPAHTSYKTGPHYMITSDRINNKHVFIHLKTVSDIGDWVRRHVRHKAG